MRTITVLTLLFLSTTTCGVAQQSAKAVVQKKTCTESDAKQSLDWALSKADHVRSWSELYRTFKEFGQCDDGAVGEAYSETTAQLLIKDWKEFPALEHLTATDSSFQNFVLQHIDATLTDDELKEIGQNARLRCPLEGKRFCNLIDKQAKASLDELKQDTK